MENRNKKLYVIVLRQNKFLKYYLEIIYVVLSQQSIFPLHTIRG